MLSSVRVWHQSRFQSTPPPVNRSKSTTRTRVSKYAAFNPGDVGHGKPRPLPVPASANYTPLNPISFLEWSARVYPDKVAIKYGDWEITYREFHYRVRLFASALHKAGLKKGEKVAVLCYNTIQPLESHYAVPLAGGVLVTVNTRLALPEISYILSHSESTFLIVDHELTFGGGIQKVWAELGGDPTRLIVTDDSGWRETDRYEQFLDTVSEDVEGEVKMWEEFEPVKDEMETISINYTSGTTGKPKGVQYTYRGCYLTALNVVIGTRLNFDSKFMFVVPMFHCNGWTFPWAVASVSGTFYPVRKIDYDSMWELLSKEKVTHYVGAPTVQAFLVNNPNAQPITHGVTALTGGSAPAPSLLGRMRELGIWPIIHVYGMTETTGPVVNCPIQPTWLELPLDQLALKMSRPGHVVVTMDDYKVVDDAMVETPWDGVTPGEVVWRGNAVTTGYYKDPEATEKAFEGGWLHSGDIGVRHPDGYIEVRDRKKDVIISGGENISTIEVEQVIASHPKVLEVAVVATPDDTWGERPKAFVVLKKEVMEHGGYEPGEIENDIIRHCRSLLAGYKCPARVQLEMELPKTGSGKIQKFILREREFAHLKKRIN
ncbi:acetyl-CoA synthetase-like protein [Gonapodya prolifera JEL478]|uniref:Acetyl-CoA synthetase-like protein n=1 Tax=Gonapodya prolifera (strain JEL478) TaxID=1344416 RepID=A0A139ADU0_GONPJ|nr:acetyl-CoA synthetase-like protein [Gonapodya prolifera JEL478]|eukprot:KXS14928.1 acetyl-CoA synthetase-like protein [Gonapodya prolifera JEL478]